MTSHDLAYSRNITLVDYGKEVEQEIVVLQEFIEKNPEAIAKEGERRKVVVTSFRPRLIDQENCETGLKPVFDALKNLKLIWDDSLRCMEKIVNQEKAHGFPKTRVTIYFDKN